MANIMAKQGALDNVVTYEHFCDTYLDLQNIPKDQINLGSTAVVLKDEDDELQIYMANSNKEWILISSKGGSGGGGSDEDGSDDEGGSDDDDKIIVPEKNVNLYNSDGTIAYSYTTEEFSQLTAFPEVPDRSKDGLTAIGWNWGFEEAQDFISEYGDLQIGAMYRTTDGKTHAFIHFDEIENYDKYIFSVVFLQSTANGAIIDWGDGTTPEVSSDILNQSMQYDHTYTSAGDYEITIEVTAGEIELGFNGRFYDLVEGVSSAFSHYKSTFVNKIYIGTSTTIGVGCFEGCINLKEVIIPNTITELATYVFTSCFSLSYITIPNSVVSIDQSCFHTCVNLKFVSMPDSILYLNSAVFYQCYSLEKIMIKLPEYSSYNTNTTLEQSTFSGCYNLQKVILSEGIRFLGANNFSGCARLNEITLPSTITKIEPSNFWYKTNNMINLHCKAIHAPLLQAPFFGYNDYLRIYVPYSSDHSILNEYKTTTNWTSVADHIYEEPNE